MPPKRGAAAPRSGRAAAAVAAAEAFGLASTTASARVQAATCSPARSSTRGAAPWVIHPDLEVTRGAACHHSGGSPNTVSKRPRAPANRGHSAQRWRAEHRSAGHHGHRVKAPPSPCRYEFRRVGVHTPPHLQILRAWRWDGAKDRLHSTHAGWL